MNGTRSWLVALALGAMGLGGALPGVSAPQPTGKKPAPVQKVKLEEYRLLNGLRVILAPEHSAPVVAVSVTYDVGSRNERPGRTGFAHLFEHMMFQGSENVGKGEHGLLISDNGGTLNGTTNQDRTNYFAAVPANQLELLLFLESDRMRALDVSQANLDNQRAVVQEERRQSYDNQAYGTVYETLLGMAHSDFAYQHSTIGSMADLNAATLQDVRDFFRIYYAPNNAALALAGDFEPSQAKELIKKYFGGIPRQPAPPKVEIHEAPATAEQRKTLSDPLARLPRYTSVYRTVSGADADYYPLALLAGLLGRGRTARLYPPLVETRQALGVSASMLESRGPGLFLISATLPAKGEVAAVEQGIDREIERLARDGVTEAELAKAKAQARAQAVDRLRTALGRANLLSQYAVFYGDPERINTLLPRLERVTTDDIRRVARKYLTKENRSVVISQPAGGGAPAAKPAGG
jgi:zinc protease